MSITKYSSEGKVFSEEESIPSGKISRDRICNDQMNTGVVAALIGGFAYDALQGGIGEGTTLELIIYLLNLISVHACTCSCLCSVFLYQKANAVHDNEITPWVKNNSLLFSIPLMKFTLGCVLYLVAVILLTYKTLETHALSSVLALIIGIMSVCMVFATVLYLKYTSPEDNWHDHEEEDNNVKAF